MKLDLRNRDLSKPISFKMLWIQDSYKKLRRLIPKEKIGNKELLNYLVDKYTEELDDQIGRFYNNVNNKNSKMSIEQFINKFINSESVLSGYGALFDDQNVAPDLITIKALENLLIKRKYYKKLMNQYPEGSDQYIMYDVIQKTYKILANSLIWAIIIVI